MKIALMLALLMAAPPSPGLDLLQSLKQPTPKPMTPLPQLVQSCCKHCNKGKPCGDSCISKSKSCNKGKGCAC